MKPKTHLILNIILGLELLVIGIGRVIDKDYIYSLLYFVIVAMNINMGMKDWKRMHKCW